MQHTLETVKHSWDSIQANSDAAGETNDCTVKALAIVAGMPYKQAHSIMAMYGRPAKRGPSWKNMFKAYAAALGYVGKGHSVIDAAELLRMQNAKVRNMTVKSAHKYLHPNRTYILCMRGHVAAMVNGEVIDWTADKKRYIREVIEITPFESIV